MEIDPKFAIWLNVAYAILTGLTAPALQAAGIADASQIVAIAALVAMPLNIVLHTIASSKPGPLAPPDPPAVQAAQAKVDAQARADADKIVKALAFLAVMLLGALAIGPGDARAAPRHFVKGGCPTSICPPPGGGGGIGPIASSNPLNSIGAWASADVDAAIKAATLYPDVQDQVGAACFAQIKTLATMIADHPLPLTLHVATDVEYSRLIQGEMNLLCRNPACAQVWSDMDNNAKAFQIAPLPISFPSLCARVPVVGLSLVIPTPAN